ncbi:hypothetical protein DFH08DRAFT_950295 [Mycena albidolilacea]|uniref:Uncharacterized protein n=1 Tax=Mycena albidolilacea TaxID=1033008 RepID=A0AAD7F3T0_9AGAR|nr:hypothetical protein DFH08DRAFT_950295 [Mycena albidolilacea]
MRLCLPQHASTLPRLIALIGISFIVISGVGYRILSTQTSLDLVQHTPHSDTLALGHPTFEDVREYERALPQHRVLTFATTAPKKYLFSPWEAWGTGRNNVFQEQLLNTHLAYLANRGYVFVDYIARDHPPFPDTLPNGTRHMLHIPMNAFTSGPIGGGSWGTWPRRCGS